MVHWDLYIKNLIFALAVMAIMRSQVRIQALIWITVLSIGYFGVKGGGFTIVNGGAYTVLGPPERSSRTATIWRWPAA